MKTLANIENSETKDVALISEFEDVSKKINDLINSFFMQEDSIMYSVLFKIEKGIKEEERNLINKKALFEMLDKKSINS